MDSKDKSLLSGMEIKESGYSFGHPYSSCTLQLIGSCPRCGCPIYGKTSLEEGEEAQIKKTCSCGEVP